MKNIKKDVLKWWLVHLLPRWLAAWLFDNINCGSWGPYIFGRMIGASNIGRIDEEH